MPTDEIELGDDAELALAIGEQLAVALHGGDAATEGLTRDIRYVEFAYELVRGQRHARRRADAARMASRDGNKAGSMSPSRARRGRLAGGSRRESLAGLVADDAVWGDFLVDFGNGAGRLGRAYGTLAPADAGRTHEDPGPHYPPFR